MIRIDPRELSRPAMYNVLIGSVVPRPIAWVSTVDAAGVRNLAPFSYFNIACAQPPMLLFCPQHRPNGGHKHTLANVEATGEFVLHVVSEDLVALMNQTSADYPDTMDEFEQTGLAAVPSDLIAPPRVADAKIAFECRVEQIVPLGGATGGAVVIGRVVLAHVADEVWNDGHIVLDALRPVARLAGNSYARVTDTFALPRPEYKA